jgi:hypothetical protein
MYQFRNGVRSTPESRLLDIHFPPKMNAGMLQSPVMCQAGDLPDRTAFSADKISNRKMAPLIAPIIAPVAQAVTTMLVGVTEKIE